MSKEALARLYDKIQSLDYSKLSVAEKAALFDEYQSAKSESDIPNELSFKPKTNVMPSSTTSTYGSSETIMQQKLAQKEREAKAQKIRSGEIKPGVAAHLLGTETMANIAESSNPVGIAASAVGGVLSYPKRVAGSFARDVIPGMENRSISEESGLLTGLTEDVSSALDAWSSSASKDDGIKMLKNLNLKIAQSDKLSNQQKQEELNKNAKLIKELEQNKPGILKKIAATVGKVAAGITYGTIEDPLSLLGLKSLKTSVPETITPKTNVAIANADQISTIDKLAEIKNIKKSLPQNVVTELEKVRAGTKAEVQTAMMSLEDANKLIKKINPERELQGLSLGKIERSSTDGKYYVHFPATTKQLPLKEVGKQLSMETEYLPLHKAQRKAEIINVNRMKEGKPLVRVETDMKAPDESNSWIIDPMGSANKPPIILSSGKSVPNAIRGDSPIQIPTEIAIMGESGTITIPATSFKETIKTPQYTPGGVMINNEPLILKEQSEKIQNLLSEQLMQDDIRRKALQKAEAQSAEFKSKMNNPVSKKIMEKSGYTLDEANDLLANADKMGETLAREYTTPGNISTAEGTISDMLAKASTTRRGQEIGEVSKEIVRDPKFNTLIELESDIPINFSEFESQGNSVIDNMFKSLNSAKANQIDQIIESSFPYSDKVLLQEVKDALSNIAGDKIITADQLRDIEQKLNALQRPLLEGASRLETINNKYISDLKKYITKNREDLVARDLELKSPGAGKKYYDLNISAANDLHDESALLKKIFSDKKVDLATADLETVKTAFANYLDDITSKYAKEGLGYNPKGLEVLMKYGEKAGIPDFRNKFKHLVMAKKSEAISHIPKGVKVTAEEVIPKNLVEGKGLVGSVGNVLAKSPIWKLRTTGKVLQEWKGSSKLDMKEMAKIVNNADKAGKNINVKDKFFTGLLLSVPVRALINSLSKEEFDSLKDEYKDSPLILNKLKAAESISPMEPMQP